MLVYSAKFAGTPDQVSEVRHEIQRYCKGCPIAEDAVLIASELASNAVEHTLSRLGTFVVRCEILGDHLQIQVEDDGGPWFHPEPDGRPHGLEIVSLLTSDWGVQPLANGQRVVWASIAFPASV